ncbi:hypothetical protein VTL71DRAFT_9795 [Oculimacula yallundae]|uniref:Uncharacterized protein n=1 Tax=Oculimacula yallundae TaxID=86028 RepID=A0ABR4BQK7_9HELO
MKFPNATVAFFMLFWGLGALVNTAAIFGPSPHSNLLARVIIPPKVGAGTGAGAAGKVNPKKGEGVGYPGNVGKPGSVGEGSGGPLVPLAGEDTGISKAGIKRVARTDNGVTPTPKWMESFVPGAKNWLSYRLLPIQRKAFSKVGEYLVNPQKGAYITIFVDTKSLPPSIQIKARDIVLDNWRDAVRKTQGSTDLRMIGTENVENPEAVTSFKAAIQAQGKDFTKLNGQTLEFAPGSPGWTEIIDNPITGGTLKMMPGLSDTQRTASVQKFSIIVQDNGSDPTFHLVATVTYT